MLPTPAKLAFKSGFSLVELSIVLVILGLLVGGVLTGQSLIRAAELRSVSSDFSKYQTALYTFRDKYFSMPGDMPNATSFWGVAGGNGSNAVCSNTASSTLATCNGNGDGIVSDAWVPFDEWYRAWQHLANAGLIEGQFVGTYNGMTSADVITRILPRGKISNSGFMLSRDPPALQGWTGGDSAVIRSVIRFAAVYDGVDLPARVGNTVLKPEEAWNIDTKIDDGKPGTGSLLTHGGFACKSVADMATAVYPISNTSVTCFLEFRYSN